MGTIRAQLQTIDLVFCWPWGLVDKGSLSSRARSGHSGHCPPPPLRALAGGRGCSGGHGRLLHLTRPPQTRKSHASWVPLWRSEPGSAWSSGDAGCWHQSRLPGQRTFLTSHGDALGGTVRVLRPHAESVTHGIPFILQGPWGPYSPRGTER